MIVFAFAGAAAAGGVVRWQVARLNAPGRPIGTLVVNVVAAFLAGLASGVSATVALLFTTACLGSMSTFSTVIGELVDLRSSNGLARSAAYGAITVVAGVGAAWLGLALAA